MATLSGQPINLQNAGLVSAAGRRLSGPFGSVEDQEDDASGGSISGLNPFTSYAIAPNAPPPSAAPQVKQFGFNAKYQGLSAGLDRNIADAGLQRSGKQFQANDVYNTQLSDAQRLQQEAVRRLSDSLGIKGLGSSTIMINERAEQEGNFNRYIDNLGRMRSNSLAQAEQGYGTALEDVNRQREGLFFQQSQEEEQLARDRAREAAEQQARQEEVRLQQEYQQQMQQQAQQQWEYQQQVAAEQAAAQRQLMASWGGGGGGYSGGGGGGGGGWSPPNDAVYGLPNGQMVNHDTFIQAINASPDQKWMTNLWNNDLGLPQPIREALLRRISGRGLGYSPGAI